MQTEEQIKELLSKAQAQTSARAATVTLVIPRDESTWVILLASGEEELAIEVPDTLDTSDDQLREKIAEELMRLF